MSTHAACCRSSVDDACVLSEMYGIIMQIGLQPANNLTRMHEEGVHEAS